MNGLFYLLPLIYNPADIYTQPITPGVTDHKHTVSFYAHNIKNLQYISILSGIELAIITTYKEMTMSKKRNVLGLSSQLYKGYFKIYKEKYNNHANYTTKNYVLKISGIWENAEEIGLTYKFVEVSGEPL